MFIWTISDVISATMAIFFLAIYVLIKFDQWYKQWVCKHDKGVKESSTGDAICLKCRKKIGFKRGKPR